MLDFYQITKHDLVVAVSYDQAAAYYKKEINEYEVKSEEDSKVDLDNAGIMLGLNGCTNCIEIHDKCVMDQEYVKENNVKYVTLKPNWFGPGYTTVIVKLKDLLECFNKKGYEDPFLVATTD